MSGKKRHQLKLQVSMGVRWKNTSLFTCSLQCNLSRYLWIVTQTRWMKLLFALLHAHKELEHGISGITVSLLTISNDYYCIFAFTIFHHLPDKVIYFSSKHARAKVQWCQMDLVEEFLVLTRTVSWLVDRHMLALSRACFCLFAYQAKVSVNTLVSLFRILRRRIPGRHLPMPGSIVL